MLCLGNEDLPHDKGPCACGEGSAVQRYSGHVFPPQERGLNVLLRAARLHRQKHICAHA